MFRTVRLSIIRSFSLYTQQWYMSYRFVDSLRAWSWSQAVSKPVWHIPLLCVQWKNSDDGQRNCPKHVEFYYQNKFEKVVHLVGFIIRTWGILCVNKPDVTECFFYRKFQLHYLLTRYWWLTFQLLARLASDQVTRVFSSNWTAHIWLWLSGAYLRCFNCRIY